MYFTEIRIYYHRIYFMGDGMKISNWIYKHVFLFLIGGTVYAIIEVVWRKLFGDGSPTHWTMFVLGGLAFVLIGEINEVLPRKTSIWLQSLIGTGVILILEFAFGCVLNLLLKLDIWDYSHLPLNILGQVCLPFAFAWYLLTAAAIVADDYLRFKVFNEEKHWFFKERKRL